MTPLAAAPDPLREPRYSLSLGNRYISSVWTAETSHTRKLRAPGSDANDANELVGFFSADGAMDLCAPSHHL